MLITTARHERIVAAKDAEIAGLMARLDRSHSNWQRAMANEVKTALLAADRGKQMRLLETRLSNTFPAPEKARLVLEYMHADCGYAASYIASMTGVAEAEVRKIIRGFEAYGWAFRHAFHSEDDNRIYGSGYSLTNEGWAARQAMLDAAA